MTLVSFSPFLFTVVILLSPPFSFSMSDSDALLQLKQSFNNTKDLDSWQPGPGPCTRNSKWGGLVCSKGIVSGIRLDGMGLSGIIDIEALLALSALRTISIVNNSFSGSIPEFNRLGALKTIYISGNQFSGEIPSDYFVRLNSLKMLWLDNNQFTGEIPLSIQLLSHLAMLHLENNRFTGTIPGFTLRKLRSFNVSNNQLVGVIPDSLSRFGKDAFSGNAGLCGVELGIACGNSVMVTVGKDKSQSQKAVAIIISVAVVIISLLIVTVFLMRKRKKDEEFNVLRSESNDEPVEVRISSAGSSRKEGSNSSNVSSSSSRRGTGSSRPNVAKNSMKEDMVVVNEEKGIFGMFDLMKAAAEVLGNGSFGSAYKAVMATGVAVVVKRMKEMNRIGRDGFDVELRRLGALQHPNILNPLGYHFRKEEKLIIYEYIPRGSLLFVLHGNGFKNLYFLSILVSNYLLD